MPRLTKQEIAAAAEAAAKQQARIRAALRWSDDSDIAPDVPPPAAWNELTTGWTYDAYARRIKTACSSNTSHAVGRTDRATTQGARWLYSTRERALRALRYAMEREFAAELAKIDAQIEKDEQTNDQ